MATVKVKFRHSSVSGKPGSIYYQLCHKGKIKQLSTNIHLYPQYWDADNACIINISKDPAAAPLLQECRIRIDKDLSRMEQIIREFDAKGEMYCLSDVVLLFHNSEPSFTIVSFFKEQIKYCTVNKMLGTARNYDRTLNSFYKFLSGNDIPFKMITEELVLEYERWLIKKGLTRNSCSFYLRNLRAIYNKAVKHHLTEQKFPFNNVYTGIDRTRKRAVNEAVIMNLQNLDLTYSKPLALARDLFIFSYCTRGMSFVDISFLKKTNISNGIISYFRRKTGQRLSIRLEPCMERIIRRYENETTDSPYVFPIITATEPATAYKQYQIALNYHNQKLKRLEKKIGGNLSLSSYTARHTWATIARKYNIPLAVISEGMGHTSEKTTQIYLASIENSVIDEANKKIVDALNQMVSSQETINIKYGAIY